MGEDVAIATHFLVSTAECKHGEVLWRCTVFQWRNVSKCGGGWWVGTVSGVLKYLLGFDDGFSSRLFPGVFSEGETILFLPVSSVYVAVDRRGEIVHVIFVACFTPVE